MDFQKIKKLRQEVRDENWSVVEIIVDEIYHNTKQRLEAGQHETIVIWSALHNPNIHESAAYTISLHRTKEGAEKAILESKKEVKKDHNEVYDEPDEFTPEWNRFHWWGVKRNVVEPK